MNGMSMGGGGAMGRQSMPGVLDDKPIAALATPEPPVPTGKEALAAAIQLHQAHMSGAEPTTEESQAKLMQLLQAAMADGGGGPAGGGIMGGMGGM